MRVYFRCLTLLIYVKGRLFLCILEYDMTTLPAQSHKEIFIIEDFFTLKLEAGLINQSINKVCMKLDRFRHLFQPIVNRSSTDSELSSNFRFAVTLF